MRIIIDTIHEARQEHKHHQKVAEGSKATRLIRYRKTDEYFFEHFYKNIYHYGDDKKPREADARHSFSQSKKSNSDQSFVRRSHHGPLFWPQIDLYLEKSMYASL